MADSEIPGHILLHPGVDRIFESLASRHRRLVLILLKQGRVETESDVILRGDNDQKREISLTHNHLPTLEDAGYIEWDRQTGEISKGARFEEIEPLLELIENHADELPSDWP